MQDPTPAHQPDMWRGHVRAPATGARSVSRPRALARAWAPSQARGDAMVRVFQRTGGLAGCEEVLSTLEERCSKPVSVLARRIVAQEVVTFEWQGRWLLPKFQFDPADMSVLPAVSAVLAELRGVVEDWELAAWFAEPSHLLQGAIPVQALGADPDSVLGAARVERFLARF